MRFNFLSLLEIEGVRVKLREATNGWSVTRSLRLSFLGFSVLWKIEMLTSGECTVLCVKWLGVGWSWKGGEYSPGRSGVNTV